MKIFGINITVGNPEKRRRKRAEARANELFEWMIRCHGIHENKIKDGVYFAWWKTVLIDYADWIRLNADDRDVGTILARRLGEYLKKREIDIEFQNDELKRITEEIRKSSK